MDANQYRRGVYTHWQRTFLHPMLMAFDAPSREECTADRPRSNTPLAALVMLNDPSQVEAARALAEAVTADVALADAAARLREMMFRVLSRPAREEVVAVLQRLLKRHRAAYGADRESATRLVGVGERDCENDDSVVSTHPQSLTLT